MLMLDQDDARARVCPCCATELAPHALACPSCGAVVHRTRLEDLARRATAATEMGDRATARALWTDALALLPRRRRSTVSSATACPRWKTASRRTRRELLTARRTGLIGAAAAAGLFLVTKFKFLLLGLTKIGTLGSMFGFIAVYWSIYGWPLAVGLAAGIYVHEMGHVAMLRRLGIHAEAPLFIPGVGAMVLLRERIADRSSTRASGLRVRSGDWAQPLPPGLSTRRPAPTSGSPSPPDRPHQPVQPDSGVAAGWRARSMRSRTPNDGPCWGWWALQSR
ncbi:MAG: hypothetical protein R2712_27045 [Vicinamibacterales bacterium]